MIERAGCRRGLEVHDLQIKGVWSRLKRHKVPPIVSKRQIGIALVQTADLPEGRSRYLISERDDAMRRHLHRRLAHDDAGALRAQPALQRSSAST